MHGFLRSIGFRNITKKGLDQLYYETRKKPDFVFRSKDEDGNVFLEYQKEVLPQIGLAFRGHLDEERHFSMEYYFPYMRGKRRSTKATTDIVKESGRESFFGVCEDDRIGIDLVFFLQDLIPDLDADHMHTQTIPHANVVLSALATEGTVLLPIEKTKYQKQRVKEYNGKRAKLIHAAKNGDEQAIEELTIKEMDLFAYVSKRIEKEDVFSIVNTYFMPNGIESDKYSVLGEIKGCQKEENPLSKEIIYYMDIDCNDMRFDMCINEKDLLGIPAVGRRIKCDIWLQGAFHL